MTELFEIQYRHHPTAFNAVPPSTKKGGEILAWLKLFCFPRLDLEYEHFSSWTGGVAAYNGMPWKYYYADADEVVEFYTITLPFQAKASKSHSFSHYHHDKKGWTLAMT